MKTLHDYELGRGTIWVLYGYNDVSAKDISNILDNKWSPRQVKGELRRLYLNTLLGRYMIKNKESNRLVTYSFDNLAKTSNYELLCDVGKNSFEFNKNVSGRTS